MAANLITSVCEHLEQQAGFVMATIISHTGSTPRVSGTRMIIAADGTITGTIGGGLLEARVMKKALEMMREDITVYSVFMPFELTYSDVTGMDMICGGKAEIFLEHITPSPENLAVFTAWKHLLEQRGGGFFLTAVFPDQGPDRPVAHAVIGPDQVWQGRLPVPDATHQKICNTIDSLQTRFQARSLQTLRLENLLLLIEPAFTPDPVFLFGAGHVARPTAHLCALTGFYVTVLDDRQEFAHPHHFPDVHDIRVLDSFEEAFSGLVIDEKAFVVIFTRGHLHDLTVLAAALKTRAGYIGMIGSRRKRDIIYRALLDMGYRQADIDRVFSPIGMAIGAQSPEEIAVSIVAEMIQQRAQRSR